MSSLDGLDAAATRRRIEVVAEAGRRKLAQHAQASAELNRASAEAYEREEQEFEEQKKREAEREAARTAAEKQQQTTAEGDGQPEKRVPPRPKSLSLGGEEFREARRTDPAAAPPPPPRPAPAPVPPPPVERRVEPVVEQPARPAKTMRLGAPEEPDERGEVPKPKPPERPKRRAPRNDADDDLSGRTWLR